MAHAPPSANASAVDPEGLKDLSLVFALHPPAPASARDRAAAGYFPRIRSDELDVPLPPRGLHVVTARDLPQVVVDDDPGAQSTDESSELPSPDPSSPGLHTPMDSPPVTTHALSMSKEDVPDIGHLFIHNRAPASFGCQRTAYRDSENLADDLPNFLAVLRGKLKEIPPSAVSMMNFTPYFKFSCLFSAAGRTLPCFFASASLHSGIKKVFRDIVLYNRGCLSIPGPAAVNPHGIVAKSSLSTARPIVNLESKYLEDATINFVKPGMDWGLKVLLDTGCCVTHLPPDAVQSMNKNLFGNKDALKEPQDGMPPPTYKIDPNCWLLKEPWKVQVVYEFGGEGTTSVFVTGPLEGFAYQRYPHSRTRSDNPDNLEGLVFSSRWAEIWNVGTLGQNFFQTMYVSLHKATDGLDFVRMAGQWPEQLERDLEDYYVAGVSSK
ncbi:hypothetical protein GSI_09743 [Ganoderma sinense ZZ0214-1]|uniref:Uncharacterized protein n=1 Tax=Ganoderma sinense ZZ0214-1 TaxID=1077348 RepID=A0A2G8S2W5_9APHY|nr:hypothetical protein GSI_09743 [Ganoderma sinense ZZ0214-1]